MAKQLSLKEKNENELKVDELILNPKDWVFFLSNESYQQLGIIFFIVTLVFATFALINVKDTYPLFVIPTIILMLITLILVMIVYIRGWAVKKCIDQIIEEIFDGKLTDSKEIHKRYMQCKKIRLRR